MRALSGTLAGRLYEQIALKQAIRHLFYWQKWLCMLLIA